MSAKKLGKIENQPGITTFVGKNTDRNRKTLSENTGTKKSSKRTPLEPHKRGTKEGVKANSTKTTVSKKHAKPENNSPDEECKQPSKKKTSNMSNPSQLNINNEENNGIVLNPEFQELKRQLFAGFEVLIEPLKKDIQDLKTEREATSEILNVETVARKFERSDEKHKQLEERLSLIEDQLLERNLLFHGINESEFEDKDDVKVQVIKAIAKTMPGQDEEEKKKNAGKTSIEYVERIGRYNPLHSRAVKVKFTDKSDVDTLLKNKRNLPKGVYLNREYSKATEKEQRYLRPLLKAARRLEKYKKKSRMEGPHLVLDGKHYYRGNLHTLPAELDPFDVTSKSDNNTVAFFGELNPLSNFHEARFYCEGEEFHCSEQFIQWKKATYFKDRITERRILNCSNALTCKETARDIKGFNKDEWDSNAEELCYEGIKQKFKQNPHLKDVLLDTGNKTLVESCLDNVWGTGKTLSDPDCLTSSEWIDGVGILGKILMKVRDTTLDVTMDNDEDDEEDRPPVSNNEEP